MSGVNNPYRYSYVVVGGSATSTFGLTGDYVHHAVVAVTTAVSANASLAVGGVTIADLPADTPKGIYTIPLNIATTGSVTATTLGNATITVVGLFTP